MYPYASYHHHHQQQQFAAPPPPPYFSPYSQKQQQFLTNASSTTMNYPHYPPPSNSAPYFLGNDGPLISGPSMASTSLTAAQIGGGTFHQQQQRQDEYSSSSAQQEQQRRYAMRKHRSLEGGQFLAQFNPFSSNRASNAFNLSSSDGRPIQNVDYLLGGNYPLMYQQQAGAAPVSASSAARQPPTTAVGPFDSSQLLLTRANNTMLPPASSTTQRMGVNTSNMAMAGSGFDQQQQAPYVDTSPEMMQRQWHMGEDAFRRDQLEQRLFQMNSENQILRMELDRRREDEDSGIGRPFSRPRDFTDHSITLHEWQTLKTKLEGSELSLAERTRELQNAELRAKCAEDQKEEIERRNDILARSNAANEAQLKLLHEDLNMLRAKLELKNQQLESREKANKKLETELEALRLELKESQQNGQEGERRATQLTHRLDQMERELREQNVQTEKLRQRLQQQPNTRAEAEGQQKLENALEDRRKLEQLVDQLRQQNEMERQQQLQQFLQEREQLQANIAYLKKELADRHVLLSSQSEKISQLDSATKSANAIVNSSQNEGEWMMASPQGMEAVHQHQGRSEKGMASTIEGMMDESELEQRLRREVDRLLKRVQQLEREKADWLVTAEKREGSGFFLAETAEMSVDERANALGQRIHDLEEALRESVECTADRDKALAEQKRLVERLSSQVSELFESSGNAAAITAHQRQMRDALAQLAESQRQLEEERQQRQRQVSSVRKELGMALVAEKEAAIALVQSCCPLVEAVPGLRERLDHLQKQKEALRHALLMSSGSGGALEEHHQPQMHQQHFGNGANATFMGNVQSTALRSPAIVHPGRPSTALGQPIRIQTSGFQPMAQHNGQHHPYPGVSAPASLNFHPQSGFDDFGQQADEEGIWA